MGSGTPHNPIEAAEWYTRAALAEHPSAQFCLATCYLMGTGVPVDRDKSFVFLGLAAAQGHEVAREILQAWSAMPNDAAIFE